MAKRTSAPERRRMLAEQCSSGMTRKEFCERHRIALTMLDSWKRAERKLGNPRLISVKIQNNTAGDEPEGSRGFALSLADGRGIECNWHFADSDLVRLIRVAKSA